jgi:predicted dienelactone hydrolase
MRRTAIPAFFLYLTLAPFLIAAQPRSDYDPLRTNTDKPEHIDLTLPPNADTATVPVRVYLPKTKSPAPVVLFSHGLGGNREGSAFLGNHWAARGYVAVFMQHVGSDDSVWKDKPPSERMAAMRRAANAENFGRRVRDVTTVLDQLAVVHKTDGHALAGRLVLSKVGMSGHSFGAVTTQAVSGERFALGRRLTDERIKAAVIMSPSGPRRGDVNQAFGGVKIPWLLLTGTKDTAPIGETDLKSRLSVYPALPPGNKYELVLDKAEHSAFTDRPLPGETEKRNPNHHRAILAVTTAFWDAYLRGDEGAKKWLDGDGPRKVLEKEDRWQRK